MQTPFKTKEVVSQISLDGQSEDSSQPQTPASLPWFTMQTGALPPQPASLVQVQTPSVQLWLGRQSPSTLHPPQAPPEQPGVL
jgi:hypothetical protein